MSEASRSKQHPVSQQSSSFEEIDSCRAYDSSTQLIHESQPLRASLVTERSTCFTLQVIDQTTQRPEFVLTPWTMIQLLLVSWACKMLIQCSQLSETPFTEHAAIPMAVP